MIFEYLILNLKVLYSRLYHLNLGLIRLKKMLMLILFLLLGLLNTNLSFLMLIFLSIVRYIEIESLILGL